MPRSLHSRSRPAHCSNRANPIRLLHTLGYFTLAACLLAGCAAQTASYQPRPDPTTPDSALVVLHVTGESGLRAGTPIERRDFATLVDSPDYEPWAVIVEGAPAPFGFTNHKAFFKAPGRADEVPRLDVFHDNRRPHLANTFCADASLEPGQCVRIAGFAPPATDTTPSQSLSAPASEQSATVIGPDQLPPGLLSAPIDEHLIWLLAPPGDYRAFRGGPVAVIRPGEPPCIAALIFNQIQNDPARGAILSALPLNRLIHPVKG